MAVSMVATLVILALPPLVLGTRLPRQPGVSRFLLYFLCIGAGVHPDRSGADSEVRAVPGPADLRADRRDLLHAGLERHRQLLQPRASSGGDEARLRKVLVWHRRPGGGAGASSFLLTRAVDCRSR